MKILLFLLVLAGLAYFFKLNNNFLNDYKNLGVWKAYQNLFSNGSIFKMTATVMVLFTIIYFSSALAD